MTCLLDHAAYLYRGGLTAVSGLDDAGPMDAMGLGWVINLAVGNRPLILQKSGGLQGSFAYLVIVPTRGAAVFVMKEFSSSGFTAAVAATNGLIGQLAPRCAKLYPLAPASGRLSIRPSASRPSNP